MENRVGTESESENAAKLRAAISFQMGADVSPATLNASITNKTKVMSDKKAPKVEAKPSVIAAGIVFAGKALGYVQKEFGKGSVVIRVEDTYQQFLAKLPADQDCSAEARLFRGLVKGIEGLTDGDAKKTWVIHQNGSYGIYGKFSN